jgi:dTDP-4-dehydrorhamnose 3,5-epimerase
MIFTKTTVNDAYIVELDKREDHRGFFARTWDKNEFEEHNLNSNLVQCNVSFSKKRGTLRGMHYQKKPFEESKLIRCTKGKIFDVIIDLRTHSSTFKKWFGVELTQENYKMLYVPEGFAHGFQSLEDNSEIIYQVSEFYTPNSELGIHWNDPAFNITWPIEEKTITEKDNSWKLFDSGV